MTNGELVYGADGFAGEIGHTVVDPKGRQCGCGKLGCLETYCSATGLCRTVQELICNSTEPSRLRHISCHELDARMVSAAAMNGDTLALKAFDITGSILGMKLADSVAHPSKALISRRPCCTGPYFLADMFAECNFSCFQNGAVYQSSLDEADVT